MSEQERAATAPASGDEALSPDVLGGRLWRGLERGFLHADRLLARVLPERCNPLMHTGAIAMIALVVALASGVLLLVWYRPSLHLAWSSVADMARQPLGAGLVRSLHRYSSDLALAAAVIHALRLFFERRFTGPRWLAWVTGVAAVGATWFVGWTGYWLVWDTRAHAVAAGTARALDVLPVFADPMGRSFLTDHSLNSLLFFVVFFAHMLVPLVMGILLWLHMARLPRPNWIAKGPLALWAVAAMVAMSVARPADIADRARMTQIRRDYAIDAWYLAPVALTDRSSGGAIWAVTLGAGLVLAGVPWWMARRRTKRATIYAVRCTACGQCRDDCPYDAIEMVPRTAGPTKYALQAEVNPDKCIGCGICAASCDGFGTDLIGFSSVPELRRAEAWVRESVAAGEAPLIVFACGAAVADELSADPATGRCSALPSARVMRVPCGGWVHMTTIERLLRVGAARVAVVACHSGPCHYRDGARYLVERIGGSRHPHFRADRAPRDRMHVVQTDPTDHVSLIRKLSALDRGAPEDRRPSRTLAAAAAVAVTAVVSWGVVAASEWRYSSPDASGSALIVTFKHPGQVIARGRALTAAELEKIPVHMRRDRVYSRERAAVRMRVTVDGRTVVVGVFPPKGVWHDGNSIAAETVFLPGGTHDVEVAIGDTHDPEEWSHQMRRRIEFTETARRVVSFDRVAGFRVD